jgi:hypothetical protein
LPPDPHQEFQELSALSTTGELTAEEWARLTRHLADCASCREAKGQYEGLIATTIPALAAEPSADEDVEVAPGSWSIEEAEATLMESLRGEPVPSPRPSVPRTESLRWSHALPYAAAALILVVCTFAGYRIGVRSGSRPATPAATAGSNAPGSMPRLNPSATRTVLAQADKTPPADDRAALRAQARLNQVELAKFKEQLSQLDDELAERSARLDRSEQDRAELNRKLAETQANAQSLEARLSLIGKETSEDAQQSLALKGQVNDLNDAIKEKDGQIAEERELLERDRDIRNLIGARNLYIAEIYDVGQSGDIQKPFGRVFYTKDKSLIFYGYDLDQQPGFQKAGAFQAWGGRGADRQHAVSLGLLYKDDANQKRWVLKFNDAKTISQIDAVFVTVEPAGGSAKPSGKPLLFTYLRLDPNHP